MVIKPWHLAVIVAAIACWYFFLRQPAAVRAPAGSSLPADFATKPGYVEQVSDAAKQLKTLWGNVFGTKPAAAASSEMTLNQGAPGSWAGYWP